jgi:hypothetical protein
MVGAVSKFAIAAARDPEPVVFRRWNEFDREALGFTPSWMRRDAPRLGSENSRGGVGCWSRAVGVPMVNGDV